MINGLLSMGKNIVINEAQRNLLFALNEDHLKVVDNIDAVIKMVGDEWVSQDDVWWIKIEARLKDYMNRNKRNPRGRQIYWKRESHRDGTNRENHVGYVIVRGNTKEACINSIRNAVVHLNPWAARELGTSSVYSNGNAEAIKLVCHKFFARSYITLNKRSMGETIKKAKQDKETGMFKGREFHHRVGQTRSGIDSSGVNWTVKRPYGLIDCDVDNTRAQAELDAYLANNGVTPIMKRQSHDGMHYVIRIEDAKGLDFSFMDRYSTNNRKGDPNVLFKPDANIMVYSAVG